VDVADAAFAQPPCLRCVLFSRMLYYSALFLLGYSQGFYLRKGPSHCQHQASRGNECQIYSPPPPPSTCTNFHAQRRIYMNPKHLYGETYLKIISQATLTERKQNWNRCAKHHCCPPPPCLQFTVTHHSHSKNDCKSHRFTVLRASTHPAGNRSADSFPRCHALSSG
jgi:hypothetical protein